MALFLLLLLLTKKEVFTYLQAEQEKASFLWSERLELRPVAYIDMLANFCYLCIKEVLVLEFNFLWLA